MREELLKEYAEEALKNGPHRFIRPDDKVFYIEGFKDGYNLGLKAKINKTTISDAPALPEDEDDYKDSIAKEAWDAVNTCTPYHPESFVQGYIAGAESKKKELRDMTGIASHQQSSNMQRHFTIKDLESDKRRLQGTITQMSKDFNYRITEMGNELERTRIGALNNLDGWRKSEAKLSKARAIIQRITEWADWQGPGCPKFENIKSDAEEFLKEVSHE